MQQSTQPFFILAGWKKFSPTAEKILASRTQLRMDRSLYEKLWQATARYEAKAELFIVISNWRLAMEKADYNFDTAYKRLVEVCGAKTQASLAKCVNTTQPVVNKTFKRKKHIPARWLLALLRTKKVNPDWVLYGDQYKKFLIESDDISLCTPEESE